jgi:hypothetical protein
VPSLSALGWTAHEIRALYERHGLSVQGWDRVRTHWLTFHHANSPQEVVEA